MMDKGSMGVAHEVAGISGMAGVTPPLRQLADLPGPKGSLLMGNVRDINRQPFHLVLESCDQFLALWLDALLGRLQLARFERTEGLHQCLSVGREGGRFFRPAGDREDEDGEKGEDSLHGVPLHKV